MKAIWSCSGVLALLIVAAFAVHFSTPMVKAQSVGTGCTDAALSLAEGQLTDTIAYTGTTQFPVETNPANGNKWGLADASHLTSGFFPGWIWFMYEKGLSSAWFARAQSQTASMLSQETNASDHDIGFKILASYGNAYRITHDPAYLNVIQTAAQAMTSLYRPGAGVIESWPNYDSHITVIIDNMMNLELLFFAAKNGGSSAWYDMAVSHALKTMENHVRPDGSTYHVVDYNPDGTVFSKFTVQGAGNETTWSRGQAWAVYGFTMTYRYTRDPRFLQTAQAVADYFISHLPADFVPYWDFSKSGSEARDSSAAAIAAGGLLELSTYVATQTDADRYKNAALNIQASLSSPAYLGDRVATDGILLHGSANVPRGDFDKSLSYGDYYFIQGCYRAKTPPAAPTNLQARANSSTEIDLSWAAEPAAVRYSVKRSATSAGPFAIVAPPPVLTANTFNDTGLSAGTTYYYVVSATGVGGESADSTQTFAVTPGASPPTISSLAPSSWTAGGPAITITVNGTNFVANSVVKLNGIATGTTFVNSGQLRARITATNVAQAGAIPVTVFNSSSSQTSNAVTFTVNKAATSTTVVSSLNPSRAGKSVTFTATVKPSTTGTPTGTVTFWNGTATLGTSTLSNGKATLTTTSLIAGSHSIIAGYHGSANFKGSNSHSLTQTVNP